MTLRTMMILIPLVLTASPGAVVAQGPPAYEFEQLVGGFGVNAMPLDINNLGVASGRAYMPDTGSYPRAVLWGTDGCQLFGGEYPVGNASAVAINDSGQAAGYVTPVSGGTFRNNVAYTWHGGTAAALGEGAVMARDINNSGTIVGQMTVGMNHGMGFIYTGGVLSQAPTLGGNMVSPMAVNEQGDYCGSSCISNDGPIHAFLNRDGTMIDLGTLPGQTHSQGLLLNDRGQVLCLSGDQYYLWEDGAIDLLTPPSEWQQFNLQAMNDRGMIVGGARIGSRMHAVLYDDGVFYDLNDLVPENPLLDLSGAYGINQAGDIVGEGTYYTGPGTGFRLTVVPEPATMGLLAMGLGSFLVRRRRRG